MGKQYKTPGVYVEEISALPTSVAQVETAIPAFIGYTPQAVNNGADCSFIPTKITSFLEFETIFCYPSHGGFTQQYSPQFYFIRQSVMPTSGDFIALGGTYYSILPVASTIYYMYNSIKLFYQNGGKAAYIVSVGGYGKALGTPLREGEALINPNVLLKDLLKGLFQLKKEIEPTMYICPEATLLSIAENSSLMQHMLAQNNEMKTAISIFDLIGGNRENILGSQVAIEAFRNNTGNIGLSYGAAYYPFVGTVLMGERNLNYTNFFGGDLRALQTLLKTMGTSESATVTKLKAIGKNPDFLKTIAEDHRELLSISICYKQLIKAVLKIANIQPASAAIAGVITTIDEQRGVWKAPATISMVGVTHLPIVLSTAEQEIMNVDASGKSINAIRKFSGAEILIWGARTLAGNDNEWRYINVRRFLIFLEQSVSRSCKLFVFEPNDANTWLTIKTMLENFLNQLWRQGALVGARPQDAYFVHCGLHKTMSVNDIAQGLLIVQFGVAIIRPAEFIISQFQQKQTVSN